MSENLPEVDRRHRTKIVATLGPATASRDMVSRLIAEGVDVFRINASHGDHQSHRQAVDIIRDVASSTQSGVGILYDLQGPKIRIGNFPGEPRRYERDGILTIAVGRPAQADELPCDYDGLSGDVEVGDLLLIDDGTIATKVIAVEADTVRCTVRNPGTVAQRKGVNLPNSEVSVPAITEKDRADAIFACTAGVDFIALSFVRKAADIEELRDLISEQGADIPIIAKIEKPQALNNLEEILRVAWGVMVARGDLGVELLPHDVPMAQKRIIREAVRMGRPVITATQMLDSMERNPRPTRAEVSDVANAVLDGSDAVMLSGETAMGQYPEKSVRMMANIIVATEDASESSPVTRRRERGIDDTPEAVADACCSVSMHLGARALVVFTSTGRTAVLISQRRPERPIFAFTPSLAIRRQLNLVWGVRPFPVEPSDTLEQRITRLDQELLRGALAQEGDTVVLSMGAPMAPSGSTNLMMVHHVGENSLA